MILKQQQDIINQVTDHMDMEDTAVVGINTETTEVDGVAKAGIIMVIMVSMEIQVGISTG